MKKTRILSIILLIAILTLTLVIAFSSEEDNQITMWTKAVCDEENRCLDIEITCEDGKITDIKPIARVVSFPEDWEDPRPESFRNKWC